MSTFHSGVHRRNLKRSTGHDCRQIDIKCEQLKDHVERQSKEILDLKESSDEVFWLQHQEIMKFAKMADRRKRDHDNMMKILKEKDRILHEHKTIVESYVERTDKEILNLKARLSIAFNENIKMKNNHQLQKKIIEKLEKDIKARDKMLRERDEELATHKTKIKNISKQLESKLDPKMPSRNKYKCVQAELEIIELNQDDDKQDERERNKTTRDTELNEAEIEKELNNVKKQLQTVLAKLNETESELEETKTRLSQAMGNKLTDNNPNISDLSDKNRPTKLAERYTELYDNQWTDAADGLRASNEEEETVVGVLLQILQEAMKFCQSKAKEQMKDLRNVLSFSDQTVPKEMLSEMMKVLKDVRKTLSGIALDNLLQIFMSSVQDSTDDALATALTVSTFTKECIEICWYMSVQDPPVTLAPLSEKGSGFNTDLFKAYTKGGTHLDYVVWPTLLLYEHGPILAKGVAQGCVKNT